MKIKMEFSVVVICAMVVFAEPNTAAMSSGLTFYNQQGHELYNYPQFSTCNNIPSFVLSNKGGWITTDTCIVLSQQPSCNFSPGNYWTTVRPNQTIVDVFTLLGNNYPESFQPCNVNGAEQINVNIFSDSSASAIMAEIRDLCSCQNIADNAASIVNYGNCVALFEGADCQSYKHVVPAGYSSQNVFTQNSFHSIAPCVEPLHCLKLNATVTKLKISDSTNKTLLRQASTQSIVMSSTTTFRNLGNAYVMHEYASKKTVQETVKTTRLQTLSSMHSVGISSNVAYETKFGIPFIDQTKISASISAGYNYTHNSSTTDGEAHVSTEEKEFTVDQRILVPPCTAYQVTSLLKFQERMPIQYTIYTEISGVLGAKRMTASDIRERLTDMAWVEDVDNFTISAKGTSYAVADFGIESYVNGNSLQITEGNCVPPNSTNITCDKVSFSV